MLDILVLAHRRPDHLQATLDSIERAADPGSIRVHVHIDGAQTNEDPAWTRTLEVAENVRECGEGRLTVAAKNRGLPGVPRTIQGHLDRTGQSIILEDDILVSPAFFEFVRQHQDRGAAMIGGWTPPAMRGNGPFRAPLGWIWGWATDKDSFGLIQTDPEHWRRRLEDPAFRKRLDIGGYYFSRMLANACTGGRPSWAAFWHATIVDQGLEGIYPPWPLTHNVGFGVGTNFSGAKGVDQEIRFKAFQSYTTPWFETSPPSNAEGTLTAWAENREMVETAIRSMRKMERRDWLRRQAYRLSPWTRNQS